VGSRCQRRQGGGITSGVPLTRKFIEFYSCIEYILEHFNALSNWFLPRSMECQRGLATRKLSVCPSVKRVDRDKTEERSVQIFIPYERPFSLVFWEEERLVEDDPYYLKFWVKLTKLERNRRFSVDIRS